jgi:hypothetical protein
MSRASERLATLVSLLALGARAIAQPADAPFKPAAPPLSAAMSDPANSSQVVLEQYLAERGLRRLLAAHLTAQLKAAEPGDRAKLAERLSRVQVQLFEEAKTPEQEAQWEQKGQEILALVPESESLELRMSLAKVRYRRAEAVAERSILRLATPEEVQKADSELRQLGATFAEIGGRAGRTAEALTKREESARDEDFKAVRVLRDQAYQMRSAGMYFAGWAALYDAMLSGQKSAAEDALVRFGWVLNAVPNRPATIDRVSDGLLKFDHVARAALACALCESIRGRDDTALRWLDLVQTAPDLSPEVAAQVWPRRMMVLAGAKRWADLEFLVNRRREAGPERAPKPMPVPEARLLAVLTLEALSDRSMTPQARPMVQSLADAAMADLISTGELRHVTDLVSRYGAISLPGDGFLPHYVHGLQAYEQARAAQAKSGVSIEEPVEDAAIANQYRDASTALRLAVDSSESARFAAERTNAALTAGLALYFAGDLEGAADRLEHANAESPQGKQGEDALWMAIVSLDKAVRSGKSIQKDRVARLATLFLQTYPRTDRAVNLLLSQVGGGSVTEDRAVEILLGIDPVSPLRDRARRQAANLLYGMYARSRDTGRDFAASRFLGIADEVLQSERRIAAESASMQSKEADAAVAVRLRQIIDASLGLAAPDLDRAARALEALEGLGKGGSVDLKPAEGEIAFRRVQVALARNDSPALSSALDRLRALGGPYAQRVDRLMYNRAIAASAQPGASDATLRDVVVFGSRLIEQSGVDLARFDDPRVTGIANAVADAAARLWTTTKDSAMRDKAIAIDRKLIALSAPPGVALHRFAELAESAGDRAGALEAWRLLLAASPPSKPEWLEARYHTIRLLAENEPAKAREAMAQLKVLRPDFGTAPWAQKLRDLDQELGPAPDPGAKPRDDKP